MIKNIAIGLICLSVIALIGLNIHQHQQIEKVSQGTNAKTRVENSATTNQAAVKQSPSSKGLNKPANLAPNKYASGNSEVDDLNYQLDAAEEELAMVNRQLSENKAKKAEAEKVSVELQKKYREDTSFKKSIRDSMAKEYADLFKKLNLSSEETEKFKDLLADEMMAQQDIYLDYGTDYSSLTKEEQEELNKRYEALNKEYESKKADLLGENDYSIYQSYSSSMGERYYVTSFMESLSSEEKLTDTQKDDLIEAMSEEVKNIVYERTDVDESASMYDEKTIARMLQYQDQRGEAYLKAANDILSEPQIEKLKAYLKREQDEYKLYLEMAALRNNNKTTEDSAEKRSE
jgi:hypothetical protein